MHESPRYLLAKGNSDSAILKLRRIAEYNGRLVHFNEYLEKNNLTKMKCEVVEKHSLIEGLREDADMKVNFFIMMALWSFISVNFYVIGFYMKYIKGNIIINF